VPEGRPGGVRMRVLLLAVCRGRWIRRRQQGWGLSRLITAGLTGGWRAVPQVILVPPTSACPRFPEPITPMEQEEMEGAHPRSDPPQPGIGAAQLRANWQHIASDPELGARRRRSQ
jgi:hypothetical protein